MHEAEQKGEELVANVHGELVGDAKIEEHQSHLGLDLRHRSEHVILVQNVPRVQVRVEEVVAKQHLEVAVHAVRAQRVIVLAFATDDTRDRLSLLESLA